MDHVFDELPRFDHDFLNRKGQVFVEVWKFETIDTRFGNADPDTRSPVGV